MRELGSLPDAPLIRASVHEDVHSQLSSFLQPLREIAQLPSDSPQQVKRKELFLESQPTEYTPFCALRMCGALASISMIRRQTHSTRK